MSNDLGSFVSKPVDQPILVGGVPGDDMFNELEFCVVGDEGECNPSHKTNCIYQNFQYRFRVFGPLNGYLRVKGDVITIVSNFQDASPMNLYKEADWGLRIEHVMPDGTRRVFVTHEPGQPITLDAPQKKNGRQWFDLQRSQGINEIECKCVLSYLYMSPPCFISIPSSHILSSLLIYNNSLRTQPMRP